MRQSAARKIREALRRRKQIGDGAGLIREGLVTVIEPGHGPVRTVNRKRTNQPVPVSEPNRNIKLERPITALL